GQPRGFQAQHYQHPEQPRSPSLEEQADADIEQDGAQRRTEVGREDGKNVWNPAPQGNQQGADSECQESQTPVNEVAYFLPAPQDQHADEKGELDQCAEDGGGGQVQMHCGCLTGWMR